MWVVVGGCEWEVVKIGWMLVQVHGLVLPVESRINFFRTALVLFITELIISNFRFGFGVYFLCTFFLQTLRQVIWRCFIFIKNWVNTFYSQCFTLRNNSFSAWGCMKIVLSGKWNFKKCCLQNDYYDFYTLKCLKIIFYLKNSWIKFCWMLCFIYFIYEGSQ